LSLKLTHYSPLSPLHAAHTKPLPSEKEKEEENEKQDTGIARNNYKSHTPIGGEFRMGPPEA
jgi:hypothetical protein